MPLEADNTTYRYVEQKQHQSNTDTMATKTMYDVATHLAVGGVEAQSRRLLPSEAERKVSQCTLLDGDDFGGHYCSWNGGDVHHQRFDSPGVSVEGDLESSSHWGRDGIGGQTVVGTNLGGRHAYCSG